MTAVGIEAELLETRTELATERRKREEAERCAENLKKACEDWWLILEQKFTEEVVAKGRDRARIAELEQQAREHLQALQREEAEAAAMRRALDDIRIQAASTAWGSGGVDNALDRILCAAANAIQSFAGHDLSEELEALRKGAESADKMREAVARYVNAQGPHLSESWRAHLIEACDLVEDEGNPYRPVRPRSVMAAADTPPAAAVSPPAEVST